MANQSNYKWFEVIAVVLMLIYTILTFIFYGPAGALMWAGLTAFCWLNIRKWRAKQPGRYDCDSGYHELVEEYYGERCKKCGVFYPFGSEPWLFDDDYDYDDDDDEHGYCESCGGEWGNGWSTCICEDESDYVYDEAP